MTITAILIATGRINHLSESVASFLGQTHEDKRLIVVNCCAHQTISFEHPKVEIYNLKTMPIAPMRAKNYGCEIAKDGLIVAWDEMSVYLPGWLASVDMAIAGRDWVLFDWELVLDGQKTIQQLKSTEFSFAFTKNAWLKAGKYGPGIRGASDRNLVGRITQSLPGTTVSIEPQKAQIVRIGTNEERSNVTASGRTGIIKLTPALTCDYEALIDENFGGERDNEVCFVELGRYGDIINLLPVLKVVADNYKNPVLMVSAKFADLLEGVSYVKPFITQLSNEKLGEAVKIARENFDTVIVSQIWGEGWSQRKVTGHYNTESWNNSGMIHRFNDDSLRPVFDLRDGASENQLLIDTIGNDSRPVILVNASAAVSSPCPKCAKLLLSEIQSFWGKDYNVVDLSQIKARRLYDMIALIERAACLVSIDTSFLHLAAATNCPTVAVVNPGGQGWASTKCRGNVVAYVTYEEVDADNFRKIHESIAAAVERPNMPVKNKKSKPKLEPRIFHLVDRFEETNPRSLERKTRAWGTWDNLYERGQMIPIHAWPHHYSRNARDTIGDNRPLPYFRDLLAYGMKQIRDHDIILWCNDDNLVHAAMPEYLKFHVGTYGPCTFFRTEFRSSTPPMKLRPEVIASTSREKHIGRDGFAFTKAWFTEHWNEIPDVILGASMWDIHMACIIRLNYGILTTNQNIWENVLPADGQRGLLCHLAHASNWNLPENQKSPANAHNGKLFKEWAMRFLPLLKVTTDGNLC